MPENVVIFSDGWKARLLEFTSGTRAAIAPAEKKGHLVIGGNNLFYKVSLNNRYF